MSNVKMPFSALCLFGRHTNERGGGEWNLSTAPPGLAFKQIVREETLLPRQMIKPS